MVLNNNLEDSGKLTVVHLLIHAHFTECFLNDLLTATRAFNKKLEVPVFVIFNITNKNKAI